MGLGGMRSQRIKQALLTRPYVFIFLFVFFAYILFNYWINDIGSSSLFRDFKLWFLILFLLFNFLLIPFLVGLTVSLVFMKLKDASFVAQRKAKGGTFAVIGTFLGVLGGACPGCFVGLFPAFLGIFGVTATLRILPFYGLEVQVLSMILLVIAIGLLTRETVCKVTYKN